MATIQRKYTHARLNLLFDLAPLRKVRLTTSSLSLLSGPIANNTLFRQIRGLTVPRIVRTPDACLTCRRHDYKCSWGLPTCVTCDKNGYECIQPISVTGYEDYVRDGDAQQPAAKPNTTKRRKNKNKNKNRKRRKNKNKVEIKIEPKAEETMAQIKPKSRFDDGVISWNPDLSPIFQKRNPSIPIPKKIATHRCTRQPVPLYASGSGFGAELGANAGSASASASASVPMTESESTSESTAGSESESSSASISAVASTTASGPAPSGSAFESEFVTRIKRHLFKSQQRKLEYTPRYVKLSGSISSDDVDKDHDYAAYYDYEHEYDPDVLHEEDPELSKIKSLPCMSNLYVVQNSWQGPGEPPLSICIDDYISYMAHNHLEQGSEVTPLPLSLMASCSYTASDTLFYYEKRPANCGVADIPDINPVNPKLVRLGYANPLALQLIIAQRANHREVSSAFLPTGESAERFLRDAIAPFGPKIDRYLAGGEHEMPSLFVASIVVALVEVGLPLQLPILPYMSVVLT